MSEDAGRLTRRNIAPMIAIAATTKSRIGRGTESLRKVESSRLVNDGYAR